MVYWFNFFETEEFKDVLEYGIGYEVDFNQALGSYDGNLTMENRLPDPENFAVSGAPFWFLWATDFNIDYTGWELQYAAGNVFFLFLFADIMYLYANVIVMQCVLKFGILKSTFPE